MSASINVRLGDDEEEREEFGEVEPSEEVRGIVTLRLMKPRAIRSITATVVGETKLRRTKKCPEKDEIRTERYRHLEIRIPLLEFAEKTESENFEVGEHKFPLLFRLPVDIPGNLISTSHNDPFKGGQAKYEVLYWVEVECRAAKRNPDSCGPWMGDSASRMASPLLPFRVTERIDLEMFPSSFSRSYFQQVDLTDPSQKSDISPSDSGLRCILSLKRRYFSPGDAILVSVRFYNKTPRSYQGFLLDLIKTEDYNVRDNGRDHKKHKTHVIAHKFVDKPIVGEGNTFLCGSVVIPEQTTPVTSNGFKRRVKIGYFLEVRMAYGKQLDRIPILVLSASNARTVSSSDPGNVWREIVKAISLSSGSSSEETQSPTASSSSNQCIFDDDDDTNVTLMV